jgi:hypothetical protein
MAATARRRASGEDSIYFDAANNCWTAAISLGFSPDGKRLRPKVTGRTKTAVKDSCQAPGSDRRHVQAALAELAGSLSTRSLRWSAAAGRPPLPRWPSWPGPGSRSADGPADVRTPRK